MTPARAPVVPPRAPGDIPDHASLDFLACRYESHKTVALRGTPHLYPAEKRVQVQAALAMRAVLMERLDRAGWDLAVASLRAGLTIDETAESMGIHVPALLMYLAAELNERCPDDTERDEAYYDEVRALIAAATPDRPA